MDVAASTGSALREAPPSDWRAGLERCLDSSSEVLTVPPACYASHAVFEIEQEAIFENEWICIGRADRFRKKGDYEAIDIAKWSLIVLRDNCGALRAFANSCRHRSARLLDGKGRVNAIRCPFHCWTYGLDGRLVGAPRMDAAPDFDKAEHGLVSFAVDEAFGFAFVHLGNHPAPLSAQLGDFQVFHGPWPLAKLATARRRVFDVGCNWKAFLDVFNEYYHLPMVHPKSIAGLYADPSPADPTVGAFATQFGVTKGTGGLLEQEQDAALPTMPGLSGKAATGTRYTWLYPNATFALGHDALWLYEVYPTSPGKCRVAQSVAFPEETAGRPDFEASASRYYARMDAAMAEDIPALENQRRGLSNPRARQGSLHPLLESSIGAFAKWYAGRLLNVAHSGGART